LISDADVFLQNWPFDRAEALGLDAGTLHRVNPRLVYAHAAGWTSGLHAPCTIASDYLVQAHAACGDGLYPEDEVARPSRLTLTDVMGGLLACEGVLAGLCRRQRSGRGQRVETSLFDAAMSLQAHVLAEMEGGCERGRVGGRPRWNLLDQPLAASDHYVFAGPLSDDTRRTLAGICNARRADHAEAIAARMKEQSATYWLEVLRSAGIPAVVVCRDLRQLPADPLISLWLERADDACWVPAAPWRFGS
jgi:crotonobetainyl-CoA:carnitine CoA-transferase CaiB-like acyl-CoA transferase